MRGDVRTGRTARETLATLVEALEVEGAVYAPFVNFGAEDQRILENFDQPDVTGISIDSGPQGPTT